MSVATKNPFALLDDDEAPAAAPVTKQEPAPTPAPAARGTGAQKSRGGPAARGGKYYPRGGGKPQSRDAALVTEYPEGNKPASDVRGERGERRGRGRGGRGDSTRRGRPFDRHSQTGQTDSDKKIQQSWGGADGNTELETETAAKVDAAAESTNEWGADPAAAAADWGAAPASTADAWAVPTDAAPPAPEADAAKAEGRPRREREPEEDDNTLTLDQYIAQQKEKDSLIPKLENTRKANEGADDNIWKDAVPLAKNEEEDAYFVGKSKSAPKARAKKEDKVYLEIEARFDRPDRGGRGRGRGDRGEHRGDRGRGTRAPRGAPRGGRQNGSSVNVVNVDDQTDFPTLS